MFFIPCIIGTLVTPTNVLAAATSLAAVTTATKKKRARK